MALKEHLEKIDGAFLAFTIGYALVLMLPIYDRVLVKRQLFGYDVPQYILTAKMIIEGNENIFSYPYPLTPLLYVVPAFIVKDPIALYALMINQANITKARKELKWSPRVTLEEGLNRTTGAYLTN